MNHVYHGCRVTVCVCVEARGFRGFVRFQGGSGVDMTADR